MQGVWHGLSQLLTPFFLSVTINTTNSTYFLGREADAQPLGQKRRLVEVVIKEDGPFFDERPAPAPAPAVSWLVGLSVCRPGFSVVCVSIPPTALVLMFTMTPSFHHHHHHHHSPPPAPR